MIFMCQAPTNIILKFLLMLCKHQIADKIKVKARKRWCRCLLNNLNLALGMRKLLIIISVHNWTRIKNWDSVNITRTTLMRNIYVGLVESNCSAHELTLSLPYWNIKWPCRKSNINTFNKNKKKKELYKMINDDAGIVSQIDSSK